MKWIPIDIAPPFVRRWSALVAQRSEDGSWWMKVEVWDSAWGRDRLIADGVTHYCKIGTEPPTKEDDTRARNSAAIFG